MLKRTLDGHPALMIKPAVLARSGVFWYSYDEMVQRGFKPKTKKDRYSEYRSPAVVIRSKDKYPGVTVTVEHTEDETSAGNFHDPDQRVTGIAGENISVDTVGDEVALNGNIYFYTKDGLDYYNAGNKETSGDLKSRVRESIDPKYDFECVEILSVNGVVLTERGRGGPNVRVQDSTKIASDVVGGLKMKKGVLGFLGIGRTKDDDGFKLSKVLMEEVKKIHTLKDTEISVSIARVTDHVSKLSESETRELLAGAVADSFRHPVEAVAQEAKVSEVIDKLYNKCRVLDAEEMKKTMDALGSPEETEEEDELDGEGNKTGKKVPKKKDTGSKDTATLIEEALVKGFSRVNDRMTTIETALAALGKKPETPEEKAAREKSAGRVNDKDFQAAVNAEVAKQLGAGGPSREVGVDTRTDERTLDSLGGEDDASFVLQDIFGK